MTVLDEVRITSRRGPLARANPVAKLAAAALIGAPLIFTLDWLSACVALGLELLLIPLAGIRWREFWLRTLPVWIAAPLAGVTIALYGRTAGEVYVQWWLVEISEGSIALALATFARVLAIALPSIVLFIGVDSTDLADGLGQIARLPAKFVLGALAGMRMVGLFMDDWRALELARRARGVADSGRIRRFLGMAFALLVLSIRRGTKLATAMEARGFGGPTPRTWARESRLHLRDWMLMALALAISLTAIATAMLAGTWNFIFTLG